MLFRQLLRHLLPPVIMGLVIAVALLWLFPALRQTQPEQPAQLSSTSFASAVQRAGPAVVNVYSTMTCRDLSDQVAPRGLGSGVIMSSAGYILTNYHLVGGADQIVVSLQDGRLFQAQIVGVDQLTDLAVIRIQADSLPVVPQQTNYAAKVGDVVLAIGNPYNLGQTITQGIISAKGRIGISSTGYQDFIQTDAAINAGNSGGALVSANGVLVGINTSTLTGWQGTSEGIGFAIPYRLARQVMEAIVAQGRVTRGYLGVNAASQPPVIALLDGQPDLTGVLIESVAEGSPAEAGGLRPNDVLVAIDGQAVQSVHQVIDIIAETEPGQVITMEIVRQQASRTIPLTIGERGDERISHPRPTCRQAAPALQTEH